VLNELCRQMRLWLDSGCSIPCIAGISAKQFQDPTLLTKIDHSLREFDISASCLQLAFAESTAMIEVDKTIQTAELLAERGISIIIDDFGSGYSSMTWLKHLHAKAIKIDRFFTQNLGQDTNDAAIVKAIVSMAHSMGIQVIAEGVETEEQLALLRSMEWDRSTDLACDLVQGYLFAKPMPAEETLKLLKQKK
jgi:diguanylate cyclase